MHAHYIYVISAHVDRPRSTPRNLPIEQDQVKKISCDLIMFKHHVDNNVEKITYTHNFIVYGTTYSLYARI